MPSRSFAVVAAVLALTACTGEVNDPVAQPTPPPAQGPTGPSCPGATPVKDDKWPKELPAMLPRPVGFAVDEVDKQTKGNVTQVRGFVPMSMFDAQYWVVRELPKAGFTIGRGDAEQTEIDAPFSRGDALRGLLRIFATRDECRTYWAYAVVRNLNAPYDISYTPPPSSTPLPFG